MTVISNCTPIDTNTLKHPMHGNIAIAVSAVLHFLAVLLLTNKSVKLNPTATIRTAIVDSETPTTQANKEA